MQVLPELITGYMPFSCCRHVLLGFYDCRAHMTQGCQASPKTSWQLCFLEMPLFPK